MPLERGSSFQVRSAIAVAFLALPVAEMSFSALQTFFVCTVFATERGATGAESEPIYTPTIPWSSVVLSADGTVESEQLREIGPLKWQSYGSSLSKSRDQGTVEGLTYT